MYSKEILGEILLESDCRTIDETGQLYPPSHSVYDFISRRMEERDSRITPKHIYTILNTDRNGFQSLVRTKWNLSAQSSATKILNETASSLDTTADSSATHSMRPYSKKIKIVISAEKYKTMKPEKNYYSGRVYWKFRRGWADVIAEALRQQHNMSCVFCPKGHNVHPSARAENYASFNGKCAACNAKIQGPLKKEPQRDEDAVFVCHFTDIVSELHTGEKKRQLRGERRKMIATRLIKEKKAGITFRYEEAKRLKTFGGKNPPILPTKEVLRKAKEQQLLEKYGLAFGNPALNLLHHMKTGKYAHTIHKIGLEKFFCIYWTPEQQQIYAARCKGNAEAIFRIDATGGVAKRDTKHDPVIFLYQCMLVSHEGSVPVFQMISADHTAVAIGIFLWFILAKGAPIPPIVVTDFGWALLIAVAKIFGGCNDLKDYLQRRFDVAILSGKAIPNTYIRLDVSHIIHMVSRWKCLGGKGKAVRNFYKRCVAQAYQMADIEVLAHFLESVLVVALSEFVGLSEDNDPLPSKKCLRHINHIIRDVSVDDEEKVEEDDDPRHSWDESDRDASSHTAWKGWANSLNKSAMTLVAGSQAGSTINGCYNPEFANNLNKILMPYVALWTGIMRPYFHRGPKIATSSAVESEFADLKKRSLKGILPTRPDKFIMQHIDLHLDGKVKLASNEDDLEISHQDSSNSTTDFQDDDSNWNSTEKGDQMVTDSLAAHSSIKEFENLHTSSQDAHRFDSSVSHNNDSSTVQDNVQPASQWTVNENWRGKGETITNGEFSNEPPPKRRTKPTCLDKCPEWDYIQHVSNAQIPVLKNGGKVILDKDTVNLQRTCAFDATVQLLLSALASNRTYREQVSGGSIPVLDFALSIQNHNKVPNSHYKERAKILISLNLFRKSITVYTRTIKRLNAECNVAHLAESLFVDLPSAKSNASCICGSESQHTNVMIPVNVDILLENGLAHIQQAIDSSQIKVRSCRSCKKNQSDEVEYGPHIFIDLSIASDNRYGKSNKKSLFILSEISQRIVLDGKEYELVGLVHYMPGHYVSYAKSGLLWYRYDDLHKKRENAKGSEIVLPHLIMYAISDVQKKAMNDV